MAAPLEGQRRLREIFQEARADFVSSYAGGVEALLRNDYSRIVVDLLFAESRMVKFARQAREEQPEARVACVNASGYPLNDAARGEIDARLRRLGCTGLIPLAALWAGQERRSGGERRGSTRSTGDRRQRDSLHSRDVHSASGPLPA